MHLREKAMHQNSPEWSAAPLADRMRPRSLDEFVGQDAIIGPGRLLRRAIQADQLSSVIFSGPPGTGKTTLARIIANTTRAHFIAINAVLAGVKDIREAIDTAQQQRQQQQRRTLLFIDEVHRFNKAQQDALLPWVENGTVVLIGATTENPYFEVNKALVSRSRVFQLRSLDNQDLRRIVAQALRDPDRGYGRLAIQMEPEALSHLVNVANGDARALLNALELAVETTPPAADGTIPITLAVAEDSIQQRAVLYDKEGDAHFDTISAFIKSLRGSDPDAALYWLARMVYAGEDPRFIFRRMLILAGEDVGLADPQAIVVVNACATAFDRVGLPEGRYPLAQAALYLATAPKSNSVMGFFDALATIERERETEVPHHLKDASRDQHSLGHGAGYLYPHAYRDHWVAQQYLPASLQGQVFYQPSDQGYESQIQVQVARQREAQLAALVEGIGSTLPEGLTFGPSDRSRDRWLQRTLSQTGAQLAQVRDRLFALAHLQRHHLVLDLNAGSGLLTWEAVRQVPEGGVYACVRSTTDAVALTQQAQSLPELQRPMILETTLAQLPETLDRQAPGVRCDRCVGRNVLLHEADKAQAILVLAKLLHPGATIVLAESIPRQAQRLYALVDRASLKQQLYDRWVAAEETIYADATDPMVNWTPADLQIAFATAGLKAEIACEPILTDTRMSDSLFDRWFKQTGDRPSYATRLSQSLKPSEIKQIRDLMHQQLCDRIIPWASTIALIKATAL
ncbi:AAA family ATPase [Leptolyngbya sp. 'hensonii']|nr:AAA family ATPase [Leptolyngbya sp. 'hensonii']